MMNSGYSRLLLLLRAAPSDGIIGYGKSKLNVAHGFAKLLAQLACIKPCKLIRIPDL